ncbi:TrkH family potassium uptake protein [Maricaulis maris]|uniref:Trk system potassium uptake protein n=1 Tax=Maricaulis maris TaxID=74318 RepID=A0A495DMJ9_9PROT|nr:TrkH family potassium uptake protein [Maricaulis maris]RKR03860.1 trk system potassium uptake protein TrkH [Maricaulis maris]
MTQALRQVLFMIGMMVTVLAVTMLAPALVDFAAGDRESATAFILSAVIGVFVGGAVTLGTRGPVGDMPPRGAFVLIVGAWLALALCAALPLRLSGEGLSWTDAVFESISGLTTTGATVITGLDYRPPGLLLWRAILQWIGGIGIIVTAMAFWPMLGIGGMQLFQLESGDKSDKVLPRATQIAAGIAIIYLLLTVICFLAYIAVGMDWLPAICHAMSTVSTGGFSTSDNSMGQYVHLGADMITTVFIVLASLPFALFLLAARGRFSGLFRDAQVRGFLLVILVASVGLTALLMLQDIPTDDVAAWRHASFNAISIITGTGFATTDYGQWGPFAQACFFIFMFIGGCAGSTTCSIKIFRFQIAGTAIRRYLARLLRPNAIIPMRYNGRPVSESILHSVLGFFFVFFAVYAVSAALLSALGLDLITALSGAGTTLTNTGPGLGTLIGPSGTFQPLSDPVKWVLTANMFIGRLEVLAVLVLLSPRFWRA